MRGCEIECGIRRGDTGAAGIVVATPGRGKHLLELKALDVRRLEVLVIDEADRILDLGFSPAVSCAALFFPLKPEGTIGSKHATLARKEAKARTGISPMARQSGKHADGEGQQECCLPRKWVVVCVYAFRDAGGTPARSKAVARSVSVTEPVPRKSSPRKTWGCSVLHQRLPNWKQGFCGVWPGYGQKSIY